jgi:hypothetical protein
LVELEAAFLPDAPRAAPDPYTPKELTVAKAFIVFAHAQLEDYLEEACREKANRTLMRLETTGTVDLTTIALVCHFGDKTAIPKDMGTYNSRVLALAPDFLQPHTTVTRLLLSRAKEAVTQYVDKIRVNNGVNTKSLLALLLPLGANPVKWEALWVAELDTFASDRGSHAHLGLAGVKQIADPFESKERIRRILDGPPGAAASGAEIYSLRTLDTFLSS